MEKKHYSDYIEEFLGSGQTVRQFATDHGMNPNSLRTALWRRKAESQVPVIIAPPDSESRTDLGSVKVEVDVGGTELRFVLRNQEQLIRLIGSLRNV